MFCCCCIERKIMLLLWECGFVDYHVRNVIHRRTDSALREVLNEREDKYEEPRVLSLKPLSMSFGFLILGLLISTIVFILEVVSITGPQKSFMQVLMDIKKNHKISNIRREKTNVMFGRIKFKRYNVWCIFAIQKNWNKYSSSFFHFFITYGVCKKKNYWYRKKEKKSPFHECPCFLCLT